MLSRLVPLTLVAAVLHCPIMCGHTPAASEQREQAPSCCGCCPHGERPTSPEQGPTPSDDSQHDTVVGQCICNGAVVEHVTVVPLGLDLEFWTPVPVTALLVAPASRAILSSLHAANQPNDGMNPGRAMRCQFMSYLC